MYQHHLPFRIPGELSFRIGAAHTLSAINNRKILASDKQYRAFCSPHNFIDNASQ